MSLPDVIFPKDPQLGVNFILFSIIWSTASNRNNIKYSNNSTVGTDCSELILRTKHPHSKIMRRAIRNV